MYRTYFHRFLVPKPPRGVSKVKVENMLNRKIKRLRLDRRGEYKLFDELCEKQGTIHELTSPYYLKFNGVVERKR